MASTATSSLRAEKQGNADNPGSWDTHLNAALDVLDSAIAGTTSVVTTGGTTTLTAVDYADDEAKKAVLDVTGATTTNATIVIPNRSKLYRVFNRTTEGGSNTTLTVKTSGGSGITVTRNSVVLIYCNGSDVVRYAGAQTVISTGAVTGVLTSSDIGVSVQAYDADLTTWAGLTPSANAQSLVTAANYSAMRTLLGLVIGTNVQAYDADLTTWAAITPSANVQSLVSAADYAAIRTLLGLVIGTNVQAYDADLTTYASITPSANVQSVLGAADYSAIRTLLGLVIGTNVQAYDADLTTWAGVTPGTGIATALAINVGSAGAPVLFNGAGGTPTSLALANATGLVTAGINANQVTNAKLAQVNTATFKGRTTASTGDVEDLTATQATALLNAVVGDSGSGGTKGLVPAPGAGDAAASKFLKADGVWTVIAGGGDALKADTLAQFAATTSLQLKGVISDETGSGALVFATSPTLATPLLGTPTSGVLTNCTGLPTIVAANEATDTTCFLAFFTAATGELGPKTNANLAFNSNTGVLSLTSAALTTPVLGTPTSGTLTNCTGLPVAGITASTVTALGVGSIELGHASDTTLARSAAGEVTIESTLIKKVGRETAWIPASSITPRTTNGAARGVVEMTTNKNMFITLDFDTTTQEFGQIEIQFPKSWNLGTVTFQPVMSHASGSGNIVWGLAGVARSDDDAGDVAFGTAQTSDKTIGTANDIYIGPESSAITIAGTPATGDTVQFQINRTVASDNLGVDARLHGFRLFYTSNASTDV